MNSDSATPADRRKAQRFRVAWPVVVRGSDCEFHGALKNLSSTGALLHLPTFFGLGAEVDVLIKVPLRRENWIGYPASVLRTVETEAGTNLALRFRSAKPTFQPGCNGSIEDSIVFPS